MTHVEISARAGVGSLKVDGIDISKHLLWNGLRVEFVEGEGNSGVREAHVHVVLAADVLDVDLPDAAAELVKGEVA